MSLPLDVFQFDSVCQASNVLCQCLKALGSVDCPVHAVLPGFTVDRFNPAVAIAQMRHPACKASGFVINPAADVQIVPRRGQIRVAKGIGIFAEAAPRSIRVKGILPLVVQLITGDAKVEVQGIPVIEDLLGGEVFDDSGCVTIHHNKL